MKRQRRIWKGVALAFIGVILVVAGFAASAALNRPTDPLGDYPVQKVLEVRTPIDSPDALPTVRWDGAGDIVVHVEGTKCNNSNEPVPVTGGFSWKGIETGFNANGSTASGPGVRKPGCVTSRFANIAPPNVAAEIRRLREAGITRSTWQLAGFDKPLPDGVSHHWQTENFVIEHP